MNSQNTTIRRQRFILRSGAVYFGGGMFLLFNFRFILKMHEYTTPHIVFRLIFSALVFAVAGYVAGSLLANRFGIK